MNSIYNDVYFNKFDKSNFIHKNFIYLIDRKEPILSYLKKTQKPKSKLLDLACGNGKFLQHAQNVFNCTGVDISPEAIRQAKLRCSKAKLILGGAEKINKLFSPKQFDIITCFDLLEHIKNYEEIIKKSYDLLKDEGLFIVSVPNPDSLGHKIKKDNWWAYKDKSHINLFKQEKWIKYIEKSKLQLQKIFYNGLMDCPYLPLMPNFLQNLFIKYPSQLWSIYGLSLPKVLGEVVFLVFKK